jgi:hypothetical protein
VKNRNNEYKYLSNLISTTGYTPTTAELNAAGMTVAEAEALRKGYYKDLEPGSTAYNLYANKVKKANTPAALLAIVEEMKRYNYDPEIIEALTADKAAELLPKEPEQPSKAPVGTGLYGGTGGGGGDGKKRWEIK